MRAAEFLTSLNVMRTRLYPIWRFTKTVLTCQTLWPFARSSRGLSQMWIDGKWSGSERSSGNRSSVSTVWSI